MTKRNELISSIVTKLKVFKENQVRDIINRTENPNILTFQSSKDEKSISIPIWTLLFENKFYIFSSKNSQKVKAIEQGNIEVVLLIVNTDFFPHPEANEIPYLGLKASAKIVHYSENKLVPKIHQLLLKKYDPDLSHDWIKKLYDKLNESPEKAWLIELNPFTFYSY